MSSRPPARLVALIAAITVIPPIMLLWLGWRLVEQDRVLERQQIQQRVDRAADLIVAALQRAAAGIEQRLASGGDEWPAGVAVVTFRDAGVEVAPRGRAAYVPRVTAEREVPAAVFARGEDREFRQRDRDGAIAVFRDLARSADPAVRAGALIRLARNQQNAGRSDDALATYARLADIDARMDDVPVVLVARYGQCKLLARLNRTADLQREAADLGSALRSGRWLITAPVYWLYSRDVAGWTGTGSSKASQSEVFAEAVATLWDRWSAASPASRAEWRRDILDAGGQTFVVIPQNSPARFRAALVTSSFIETAWLSPLAALMRDAGVTVALRDARGRRLSGASTDTGAGKAVRTAGDSGLPFTIVTLGLDPPREARDFTLRRRLIIAGLAVLVLMASVAGYAIVRAVSREMAVARLQSDFVAAVSHEFRTPLTSLRQFTDMLRDNPALGDERRQIAYEAQARAADRLTRLVESLLDFGRMQAGARRYRFETRDCTDLVRTVVDDFRTEAAATGHAIDFCADAAVPIQMDGEALSLAVRNLLDNAVKYSPEPSPIEVGVGRRDGHAVITVKDRGIGIPARERAAIFAKFQRGEQARARGIKGTGIGLAMVDEIVRAHQGRVEVATEPGTGSTFTVVLPVKA